MQYLVAILVACATFAAMEGVTWLTHKYVMHGFFWNLHFDHHNKDHDRFFEKNDSFFIIFACLSMIFFGLGSFVPELWLLTFVGLGILLYGIAYFLVHDVFIHRRFRWFDKTDNVYFRALRKAHKVHHKHLGKEEGECFGMLWVPWKYFKEAMAVKK